MTAAQTGQGPTFRLFPVSVKRVRRLGPSFVRITFTAEGLSAFGPGGDDQRIKIVLLKPGRTLAEFPDTPD